MEATGTAARQPQLPPAKGCEEPALNKPFTNTAGGDQTLVQMMVLPRATPGGLGPEGDFSGSGYGRRLGTWSSPKAVGVGAAQAGTLWISVGVSGGWGWFLTGFCRMKTVTGFH